MCLQGRVALLQRGGLPLQGEDLSLLAVRLTLQLFELDLRCLAFGLQSGILQEKQISFRTTNRLQNSLQLLAPLV